MHSPTKILFRGQEFVVFGHSKAANGTLRLQCHAANVERENVELFEGAARLTNAEVVALTLELTVRPEIEF